ncbi:aromatic acid exporter family protein [Herbiconiux sp. L3-i23]|uniref:FUSC family protein n=1 Tax=Herbiconiux sp. L3-i23 TaxID=2905871 RepID=UPI00206AB4C0|nr:FUSC family protein [Herbiconiux sp. L3-i23]BDI23109.1 FUSC family protein [Herbiconiux sp. L3-i23]
MRVSLPVRVARRVPFVQVVKTALAAVLAWVVVSALLPDEPPIFAVIAALIVVQPSVNQTYAKAFERSLGVVLGVVLALGAVLALGQQSWLVLLATVIAVFAGWALRLTPGSSTQVAISALLVLSIGAATPEYAFARIIETLIGAAIALIVNAAIVPPLLTAPARLAVARLAHAEADRMDDLAVLLDSDPSPKQLHDALLAARGLRELRAAALDAVAQGSDSLAFNPRRSRHREQFTRDSALMARLDPLVTQIIGLARGLRDSWSPDLVGEPLIAGIAEELRRAAHDLRLLVRHLEGPDSRRTTEFAPAAADDDAVPALTRPLAVAAPPPRHWVLVGALLEDLRRIRQEIRGE